MCIKPILLPHSGTTVACGQCYGCRFRKKRDWATRLMHENATHKESCFVTLTFDDKNLPANNSVNKKFLTGFIKILREEMRRQKLPKIRYFACGEYGEKKGRAHYHIIMFGYDFRNFTKQIQKNLYEATELLKKKWPYGYVAVGGVSIDSCKYVASYVVKKLNGDLKDKWKKENPNKEPEFHVGSRNPGIGHKYYEEYIKPKYQKGYGLLFQTKTTYKGIKVTLPKYYKDKNRVFKNQFKKELIRQHDQVLKDKDLLMEPVNKKAKRTKTKPIDILISQNQQREINGKTKETLYPQNQTL